MYEIVTLESLFENEMKEKIKKEEIKEEEIKEEEIKKEEIKKGSKSYIELCNRLNLEYEKERKENLVKIKNEENKKKTTFDLPEILQVMDNWNMANFKNLDCNDLEKYISGFIKETVMRNIEDNIYKSAQIVNKEEIEFTRFSVRSFNKMCKTISSTIEKKFDIPEIPFRPFSLKSYVGSKYCSENDERKKNKRIPTAKKCDEKYLKENNIEEIKNYTIHRGNFKMFWKGSNDIEKFTIVYARRDPYSPRIPLKLFLIVRKKYKLKYCEAYDELVPYSISNITDNILEEYNFVLQ